ncbi:NUDIX domain-containing protein [Bacillus sp. 1P10SD]|uniref:NUDIX hydrolase n=1 Tax=Bacillus sp. 1P10SD TaxID=3132265 RepID=UPI0039A673D3
MIFYKRLGSNDIDEKGWKINNREAVRAVILHKNTFLLIHSNRGDYKFPGGGVERNESHTEALLREIAEETGYTNCLVKEKIGVVIEERIDEYEENAYFKMTSHYFICELVGEEKIDQQLDDYEYEQGFIPKWITIDDAIAENEKIMDQFPKNRWVFRETFVLKELKILFGPTKLIVD